MFAPKDATTMPKTAGRRWEYQLGMPFETATKKALEGDATMQHELSMYYRLCGVEGSAPSEFWARQAVERGHLGAQMSLAGRLESSNKQERRDEGRALRLDLIAKRYQPAIDYMKFAKKMGWW